VAVDFTLVMSVSLSVNSHTMHIPFNGLYCRTRRSVVENNALAAAVADGKSSAKALKSKGSAPVLGLLGAVSGDQSLDLALRPLVGMEGSLLLNFGEVSQNENVMAWIVHEVCT